jgi:hypothetical protein
MTTDLQNNVIVELYQLAISEREDDRFGRVVTSKSLDEDDLIKIAVSRRTDLSPTSLKSSMEILKELAVEQIANGASVAFGLGYFNLGVNGIFFGDNAQWNSEEHKLAVHVRPTAELRDAVRSAVVDVRGMASVGTYINTVFDVASGELNAILTPGGAVNVTGTKIKIAGDDPTNGIKLIDVATATETVIDPASVAVNDPSKLTFVLPVDLAVGDYRLAITTQFSSTNVLLKTPRTYMFDYVLSV